MRTNDYRFSFRSAVRVAAILLSGAVAAYGQVTVGLTAGAATATLPDGTAVPMWGYSCGTVSGTGAACANLNPAAALVAGTWSPVVITVPSGQALTISLTNNLSFAAGTGTNTVPTSLTIVGQLGGGLGSQRTTTAAPDHTNAQPQTWFIAGTPPGAPAVGVGTPPVQGPRVQSFSTEVAAGATTALTWTAPRPGTYLLESGTHPSIQGPMGLYGIVVVTTAPSGTTAGTAYPAVGTTPAVSYSAEVPLLFSEIDAVQNNSVAAAVKTVGFSETMVWSGLAGGCGNPSSATYHQCYPPAVNYTPLYYLINGVGFNKTSAASSLFTAAPGSATAPVAGNVLVRLVNAGLRMHVPSIVGSLTGTPAVSGMSLIAEDGNPLPGVARVQSEVFMAAGKTYDVMVNVPTSATAPALPIYDRELSLSGNATERDAGMLAYISVNGAALPAAPAFAPAAANPDVYNSVIAGHTLNITDPAKGVVANDVNIYGVKVALAPTRGTLALNTDGTFTYAAATSFTSGTDTFTYCGNGAMSGATCTTVTLGVAPTEAASGIIVANDRFASNSLSLKINPPGVLANDQDLAGYPLTVGAFTPGTGLTLSVDPNGGFNASIASCATLTGCTATFTYRARNSQGTLSSGTATVTLAFPHPSGLTVTVLDGMDKTTQITDYRWIIEEDRTFYVDPKNTTNIGGSTPGSVVPTFGTNFHTSFMPVVATGCTGVLSCEGGQTIVDPTTGNHVPTVCDIGNGVCRTTGSQQTPTFPTSVHLDPTKRYYVSVLPGDAANPFNNGYLGPPDCSAAGVAAGSCGHGLGGAPIAAGQLNVKVYSQQTPFPTAKLSVFVFEDDFPLNGEHDGGGGIDVISPNEPGLGGFQITLFDDAGGTGDATGQPTYDMFNQPLRNSLAGTIDPATTLDACPITPISRIGPQLDAQGNPIPNTKDPTQLGITGMIVTCPKFESDGKTLSPLAGQAVVDNLYQGRYGVVAFPGADRIARGEEWLQTNTLDGQKAHDSFMRIGEPSFFQEFGPAGYHVSIGFANPSIINGRTAGVCNGSDPNITGTNCANSVTAVVSTERMSRTPDERLYGSGTNDSFAFTQCYVSFGDPDGEDFAFTKCDANGRFTLSGLPDGDWRITVFDQWNDMLVDGLSTPVRLAGGQALDLGEIPMNQWQANIYTKTFFDLNGNGIQDSNESGLTLVSTNIRFRDGSFSNFNNTDLAGSAGFNEVFPLFSWYVVETDSTRFKNTGVHVVYDAGGPADGTCTTTTAPCGSSTIGANMANTYEANPVPANLHVPGALYCNNADCTGTNSATGVFNTTARIDPPWVASEGWQGFSGQNSFLEFGKKPYAAGENGGIRGHVIYASTRPFDDPQLLLQLSWEPLVPNVTINLYQAGTAPDGSQSLILVDTTQTTSWDNWAQGFRSDGIPNMNCPGQFPAPTSTTPGDLFFFTLFNQPMYLDFYYNGSNITPLPNNSQFKCYDGMHNWNQLQPAPYDGMYQFPSVTGLNPSTGRSTGTNCRICIPNPDSTDSYRFGTPMLPAGKYVVEVVPPPGYELVKEEDKNILIGDNFIAPVTVQFPGLGGSIYIMPDQASVASTYNANQGARSAYNSTNVQDPTQALGRVSSLVSHEGDTGSVESFPPCVGQARIVPDFMSIFPQSTEIAPFAGAMRNLCDRKEVILEDQSQGLAKFYIFTSTHVAAHFTGVITDDFTSEFDPFSPQFGEKFSPANLPVSIKDWTGQEISRVYSDHWGSYDGLTYSTWEVDPPNPTGYGPTVMVTCMNDPGSGATPDPLFNPAYSQFCYEIPFMPGQTQYMDTPVVPTSAFAGAGYNNVDSNYPQFTPAIKEVDGDGVGPWVSAAGNTLRITALGDLAVNNYGYSGPAATIPPFNQKTVVRHYGFGTTAGTVVLVGSDGVARPLGGVSWSDTLITGTVPAGLPNCAIQQQGQSATQCGQLVITAASGKQSIDTVTVTIGGKAPTHVGATASVQGAIDQAAPGDLIIVDPTCTTTTGPVTCTTGTATGVTFSNSSHSELLIMWKPVRLQGVGAASSIINANPHPAGKLDVWRRSVNCLFGLAINGSPITGTNPFDPTTTFSCGAGWNFFNPYGATGDFNPQVDRLPLEATVGWDANLNGNLAELLQEPSLMGALEGAGITVLSKGVYFPSDPFDPTLLAGFPANTVLFTSANTTTPLPNGHTPCDGSFPSNFWCNPSSIDGLSVTNSSQGGGGIFVHGWGHNIQIANNRVTNNSGTFSGGINVGQGEFPPAYVQGSATNAAPGSCQTSPVPNVQLPYCHDLNVNIHHNAITLNMSTGDELFSATPAGAGGVSFASGSDNYRFNYNWVAGNMSTGDGGGLGHLGFSYNGDIEHNSFLFNQSTNPTISANGGAIVVMGAPDVDPTCGAATDADCVPLANSVAPSDGIGPGLVINANLIMGNAAESGSGGGIRFQAVNGGDVVAFPTTPAQWYSVQVTNNIIANNVAGWDGAGISLLDSLAVNVINNTIMGNDTTASAGPLFNTMGAPLASSQGPCYPPGVINAQGLCTAPVTTSTAQPAGLVSIQNGAVLKANLPATVQCPVGHGDTANGPCRNFSVPLLANNIFWQNRTFYIAVGNLGTGTQNQQNLVTLYNGFTTTPAASEPVTDATTTNGGGVIITGGTGACVAGVAYWDIGVRGDSAQNSHNSGLTLSPTYSVLTNAGDYSGAGLTPANPTVISQYCNGSRTPPEFNSTGYQVPPGISDATVPNPVFSLTPSATVDEGNNWVNISWGPLSVTNPVTGVMLGNYGPAVGSPVVDAGTLTASGVAAPTTDFFGNPRVGNPDLGAIEFRAAGNGIGNTNPPQLTSINPSSGLRNTTVAVTLNGTGLTGATAVTVSGAGVTVGGLAVVNDTTVTASFTISTTAALGARAVTVTTPNGITNSVPFTVVLPSLTGIFPQTGLRGTTVAVTLSGANLTSPAVFTAVTGITITGATVVNSTTITANFVIASTATPGVRSISVSTPSGLSNTVPFNVVAANVPVLTSISPSFGLRNTTVAVTLTGTNLNGATAITLAPAGGITAGFVSINPTTITANFIISSTAALGPRLVTITAPGGTSNAVQFTVPSALISSVAPSTGVRGQTLPLTLTGQNFTGATGLTAAPATGLTITGFSVVNSTTATATLAIATGAAAGVHTLTMATPEGNSNAIPFTVLAPTASSISPATGLRGTTINPVTITGTNFAPGSTVTVSGTGVTVGTVNFVNSTTLTTTFTISITATLSPPARTVTVNVPGLGSSSSVPFTVTGAAISTVSPNQGLVGSSFTVTFTGSNLGGVTAGTVAGGGVTVSGITAAPTSVTATVTITATATRSVRTISLSGTNGATNTLPFTVGPFVASISPTSGTRGATTVSVPITLTGVGLTGATTLNGLETGVSIASGTFMVVNDTTVTVTLNIDPTAAAAVLPIGVATPSGNSNTVNFTVN